MGVSIPPILVVIACKTVLLGPGSPVDASNEQFTKHENREWAYEHSMMICRRHEVQLYDPDEGQPQPGGGTAFPLKPNFSQYGQCARAGIRLAIDWDDSHRNTPWRVWRVGCPTPIINGQTGEIIGYKLPECGHRDTVVCETDSVI